VFPIRDEEVHQARVLELVGDDRERDLLSDARAAELEIPEMRRDEDDPAALVPRGLQMREGDRIDRDQLAQLGATHRGKTHDLGEVFAEIAERATRDARDLGVFRWSPEHDREIAFRDLASASPDEVREF